VRDLGNNRRVQRKEHNHNGNQAIIEITALIQEAYELVMTLVLNPKQATDLILFHHTRHDRAEAGNTTQTIRFYLILTGKFLRACCTLLAGHLNLPSLSVPSKMTPALESIFQHSEHC